MSAGVLPVADVRMEQMSSPEIAAAIVGGYTTAIVPIGAIEQHGPHLPTGTDAYIADALARRVALRLGDALVTPAIRVGQSAHHGAFAGTISISDEVLGRLLDAHVESLLKHGTRSVVVFSSHAGNYPALARWSAPKAVIKIDDLSGYLAAMLAPARRAGREDTRTPHGDLTETSAMLALDRAMVRENQIARGFVGAASMAMVRAGVHSLSESGVLGDPTAATATLGLQVLASLEQFLVEAILKARQIQ